jgi:hypothetical protein
LPSGARARIRRFIAAFLAYEVGGGNPATTAAIRAHASPPFARQLLSDPPSPLRRPGPGGARITSLHVDPVPGHPHLALASGEARRPQGAEPFSFLFEGRAGRWVAVAPGE